MSRRAPGPRRGDRVGGLDDHRLERRPVDVHVVRGHRHARTGSLSPCLRRKSMPSSRCVPCISRSIALPMSCRNAARTATCASRPTSRAMMPARHATSARVVQHVLPVAGAELQPAHQPQDLRDGGRAGPSSKATASPSLRTASSISSLTFSTTSSMRAGWMRPSAISRSIACLRDLAAVGIEAREDDRARRVVDDQVDAGGQLERADVAPLAADDAPLQVVARQVDDRDRGLDGVLGGAALDGLGDVLLGAVAGGLSRASASSRLTQVRGVVPRVALDLLEQQLLGLVRGQAGDALELVLLLRDQLLVLARAAARGCLLALGDVGASRAAAPSPARSTVAWRSVERRLAPRSVCSSAGDLLPVTARLPLGLESAARAPSPWPRAALPSCGFRRRARRP